MYRLYIVDWIANLVNVVYYSQDSGRFTIYMNADFVKENMHILYKLMMLD